MKKIIKLIIFISMLLNIFEANATCSISHRSNLLKANNTYALNFTRAGNIIVTEHYADVSVGIACDDSGGSWQIVSGGQMLPDSSGFSPTGVDNIALRIKGNVAGADLVITQNNINEKYHSEPGKKDYTVTLRDLQGDYIAAGGDPLYGRFGPLVILKLTTDSNESVDLITLSTEFTAGCNITLNSSSLNIGNVLISELPSVGGISNQSASTHMRLLCDRGVKVTAQANGVADPNLPDVYQLQDIGGVDVASGIGVQLFLDMAQQKKTLWPNIPFAITGTSLPESVYDESMTLVAHYYRLRDTVIAGKANALVTLNFRFD